MRLSCNEIAGLAVKAARGAGLPLGHAEDIGAAAVLLAARGAMDALVQALDGVHAVQLPEAGRIERARAAMAGPTSIDLVRCGAGPVELTEVDAPALVEALAARAGVDVEASRDGTRMILSLCELDRGDWQMPKGPIEVAQPVLDRLNSFAARTYVPATETSRLAGAGAGLTDND